MSAVPVAVLTAAELRNVPLATLVQPPPGRVVARVRDWLELPLPVSRHLAARWADSERVRCPVLWCGASIRGRAWDAIGAVLGDVDPVPPQLDCLFHGPAGVGRQHPPAGPVRVCVGAFGPLGA